jgi:hypothetical protein
MKIKSESFDPDPDLFLVNTGPDDTFHHFSTIINARDG